MASGVLNINKNDCQGVDLFDVNKKPLRVIGFWPLDFKTNNIINKILKYLHSIYALIVFVTIYICYPIFEVFDWFSSWRNLQNVTENICITGIHIGGLFKCINLIMKKSDVNNCMNDFQFTMRRISSANNRKDHMIAMEDLMISTKKKCDCLTKWFICLVVSTGITCIAYPLTDMSSFGTRFPFRSWMPFDTTKFPICAYIYKSSAIFIYAALILECDILCVTFLIHLATQIQILQTSLSTLGSLENDEINKKSGNQQVKFSNNIENSVNKIGNRVFLSQNKIKNPCKISSTIDNIAILSKYASRSDKIYSNFKACVIHHQYILRMANDIENLFSNTILIQFFVSIVGLCLSGLQITVRTFDSVFIAMLSYFMCTLTEILLFCWFANEAILESEKLVDAAYNSQWRCCDKRLQKSLLIFMERAKKPISLTVGRFFLLSLKTFTHILSRSYSILALLRNFLCGETLVCHK